MDQRRKGKRFEYFVRDLFRKYFPGLRIERMPMSGGLKYHKGDILFKDKLPVSVECKNQEANKKIFDWWDQTLSQIDDDDIPLLFINRRGVRLAILDAEDLVSILKDALSYGHHKSKFDKPKIMGFNEEGKGLPFSKDKQLGK